MSRWFRHYAGMMRDEKLVRVAVKAKQPVERVVWVWGAILESAAEINDAGRYEFDAGEAAYFLRCDEPELVCIVECLENSGRISGGMVVRWGDRQFDSDGAKERQRRYRERVKARGDIQQRDDNLGEASQPITRDVTPPSRDGAVTAQETETETEKEEANASSNARAPDAEFEDWYSRYPHKVQRGAAVKAFRAARKQASLEELIEGLHRYIGTKPEDRQWQNPATWLNGQGWLDEPAGLVIRNQNRPPGDVRRKRNYADVALDRMNGNGSEGIFGDHGDAQRVPAGQRESGPDDGHLRGGIAGRYLTGRH